MSVKKFVWFVVAMLSQKLPDDNVMMIRAPCGSAM
jgi:hypothetical protein